MAQIHENPLMTTGILAVWGVFYMVSNWIVPRFVTDKNATSFIIGSCFCLFILSCVAIFIPSLPTDDTIRISVFLLFDFSISSAGLGIYAISAISGILIAMFFAPFQVFMKTVDSGEKENVSYSTGMYTFSWSMGFAFGPFISGWFMELGIGWELCFAFSAFVSLLTALGIWYLRNAIRNNEEVAETKTLKPEASENNSPYDSAPDMAWVSWIVSIGILIATMAVFRSLFIVEAEQEHGMPSSQIGMIFFISSIGQAFTALFLIRGRDWMYKAIYPTLFNTAGVIGLILIMIGQSFTLFLLGGFLIGICTGAFFFYFVFHAIVHPKKSIRYVGINELLVGLTGVIGAFLGPWIEERHSYDMSWACVAALIVVVSIFQFIMHFRKKFSFPPA
ncbi:MAG: hypothetical protein MJH11_10180 [Lentisphaeria bacterium]|nr:hypothetical protein [Lentisphaeria bacterium]